MLAQQATITGVVKDYKTLETLPFTNVTYAAGKGTSTDFDGKYTLKVDPGSYTISFSFSGYQTFEKKVTVAAGETKTLNASLKEKGEVLDQVVVSAGKFEQNIGKVTVSMETIDPELVENRATNNAKDIITQVPSVHTQEGQVSIRGGAGFSYGAGSRVLLMVDGIPMLAGDAGDVKWNYIPVENIENIEVIKGASSVLYGSSALNGVINVRTGFPRAEPVTKVNINAGVIGDPARKELKWWDGYRGDQSVNFYHSRIINKNFDFVIGGNAFNSTSHRQLEYTQRGRLNVNTRYRDQKIKGLAYGLNFNSQVSEGNTFFAFKSKDSALIPSTGTSSDYNTLRYNIDPYLEYFNKNGDKHSIKTRWFSTKNNSITNAEQSSGSDLFYGEYQYQHTIDSSSRLTTGATGTYTIVNSNLFGDHNSSNLAAYAQLDKAFLSGRLNTSLGFRAEYFRINDESTESTFEIGGSPLPFQPILRAGVNYQAAEYSFIRASYGQGYRFPSIAEKFVNTSLSAINVFPNPQIEPETGWSAEIGFKQGIKLGDWKGFLDISAFVNQYNNMMEYTFGLYDTITYEAAPNGAPGASIGFQSRNVQSARITGLDVSLVGKGEIGNVRFTVLAGYTFMNPKSLNSDSAYLATFSSLNQLDTSGGGRTYSYNPEDVDLSDPDVSEVLKYRFNHLAKFDIQADYNRFSTGVSMRYTSKMFNIDQAFIDIGNLPPSLSNGGFLGGLDLYREKYNRGVAIFDYRVSYEVNTFMKAAFLVENVFNTEYTTRPGFLMAPRTYRVQLSFKF